jgi:hypothetical protein
VIAEGLDADADLQLARSLRVCLGQGELCGARRELPAL